MKITAYMLSCPEREPIREQTLASLKASDWNQAPRLVIDKATTGRRQDRQEQASFALLQRAHQEGPELILFLEDDLEFNRHLRYNLERWEPLAQLTAGAHFFGSLYNPNVGELERRPERNTMLARPETVYGSQAVVLSRATLGHLLAHWGEVIGMQDIKMSRLASRVTPLYYHTPSLVQHTGVNSVWGGHFHTARDYSPAWKASPRVERPLPAAGEQPARAANLPREAILRRIRPVEGWLDEDEAALLIETTAQASRLGRLDMVEVGSYCGKATLAMALTLKALGSRARLTAIDAFDGTVSIPGGAVMHNPPTYEQFTRNLRSAGVSSRVSVIRGRSADVEWERPISLLLIDGLHDALNVAADFHRFARWLAPAGLVAFHDYSGGFPSVCVFVAGLVQQAGFRLRAQAGSLAVLE